MIANKMSRQWYVVSNVMWMMLLIAAYMCLCYKSIDGLSNAESTVLFIWLLMPLCQVIGYFTTREYCRNRAQAIISALIGIELYTCVAYFNSFRQGIFTVVVITACFIFAFFVFKAAGREHQTEQPDSRAVKVRLLDAYYSCRTIFAVSMLAVVAAVALR